MILIYIFCFFLFLYYLYRKNYLYWESRGIPTEKSFFIFGSLSDVLFRRNNLFDKVREIYNNFSTPYSGIYVFNQPNLVIRSPELIKKVLVKDFDKFINRPLASNESVDPIAFHTLSSSKDETWRNLRAKMSPVFTSGKIKLMYPLMRECASDLLDYLKTHNEETLDMREVTKKYAVDIISSCAFGINSYCLKNENSEIMKIATQLLNFKSFVRSFSVFSYFFMPKFVDVFRLKFADKEATNYLINVFNTTLNERKKKTIVRNDLIDLLQSLKEIKTTSGYTFDDPKMSAQAIAFFSAGNDTTSLTISFALYELALNPDVQDNLREDIKKHFEAHGDFTYEAIHDMKYLDMVLSETLRKYPLTNFINRKSVSKYTFEETGFTLDKDVAVFIPVTGLHYDEKYFPNPEKFNPERFSDENKRNIVPYTYLPFGDGPRICIGQRFAMTVMKVALAYIIQDFRFERTSATDVPLQFDSAALFLMNKNGICLKTIKI